ncbi:phospholipase A2 inhibitor and Ly6/PLAUR domain-containing protein-like [Podarcis raffonei]|uniref:phospholipase A2 inhibitor and Ly6/PLAUR domain-containing protein-like n=1 Tax=Podarcis raffonei TaxID=65483 RepID=UPI00232997A0|nr:phospholipase A2 inhibitor and Ly6/PLAUR domain-containing protein-like [Podarcis raffonei]
MQKALLSTCLLLALLSPVTSLECSDCHSRATSCENNGSTLCYSNKICVSGVLDNNIESKYKVATFRGCSKSERCHSGDYSLTSASGKYLQMKVFCCGTEKCNKEPLYVPPREDLSPNGLECPACFDLTYLRSNFNCESKGTVSCLGNETKCIDYTSLASCEYYFQSKLKLKGCATEDVCALNGKKITLGRFNLDKIITQCSDATKQIELEG